MRRAGRPCGGGPDRDRRDEAIIRLMLKAIVQLGEVVAMGAGDIDLTRSLAIVRRGRGRSVPFWPAPARSRPQEAAHLSGELGHPATFEPG